MLTVGQIPRTTEPSVPRLGGFPAAKECRQSTAKGTSKSGQDADCKSIHIHRIVKVLQVITVDSDWQRLPLAVIVHLIQRKRFALSLN